MDLNTRDKFILIALCNNNFKIPSGNNFKIGLSTAYVIDLILENKIRFNDENLIELVETNDITDEIILNIVHRYKKNKEISYWISSIMNHSKSIRNKSTEKLIKNKTIKEINNKKLLFFTDIIYKIENTQIIDDLFLQIRNILTTKSMENRDMLLLISLIYSCNYSSAVFSEQFEDIENKIKDITKTDYCCCTIINSVKEIQSLVNQFYLSYYHPFM